jgi:Tfp pilus assembly protein PilX
MIKPQKTSQQRRRPPRGIALAIVVCVMAVAAVLGYAMLAGSALQAVASSNAINSAIADAQAESGVHLAMYYLLNPQNAPGYSSVTGWYWTGANNITFATSPTPSTTMPGSVSVTVSSAGNNLYNVTAVGTSGVSSAGGGGVTRTINAQVETVLGFLIQQAAGINSLLDYQSNMSFTGSPYALESNQEVLLVGGTIHGNVAASVTNTGGTITGTISPAPSVAPAPSLANVHDYRTYTYGSAGYSGTQIGTTIASGTTLGPTAGNPLGVYWIDASTNHGSAVLDSNVNISGTLIVKNGMLVVQGKSNTITAQTTMPGLVIDDELEISGLGEGLTVNGVLYAGSGITGSGLTLGSNVTVNGALLTNSGSVSGFSGTVNVTYNSSNTAVPNFSTTGPQSVQAVKIVSWSD